MRYAYESYKSLIVVNKQLTKDLFIENAALERGKYAANMFSRMYDWIFSEATYVEEDYEKYYQVEYNSLEEFIYKKYCINKETLDKMMKLKKENKDYTVIDFDEMSTGYYDFIELVFSDKLYDRFINFLLMRKDEDKI